MTQRTFSEEYIQHILKSWNIAPVIRTSPHQGLINHTWLIGSPVGGVLQWVNPIFNPLIHEDIHALTTHLSNKGLTTTRLLPTNKGALYINDTNGGYWRMLSFVPGYTFDTIQTPNHAWAAGALVGRFHKALADFKHEWMAPFRDAHNTPTRMHQLKEALDDADGHHLEGQARTLGTAILNDWQTWNGTLDLPIRTTHGDLKISNLHFSHNPTTHEISGLCLLDLDTIGKGDYSIEMGDAWRSWCNPAGESNLDNTRFDCTLFEASAQGWLGELGTIKPVEKDNLGLGIQRICLELSARFCTDAIRNTYFKEDRIQYPTIGQHNLLRANTQFRLATSVKSQLQTIEQIVKQIL